MNSSNAKWISVLAALFICGLIFLFLPSEIYLRNPLEFISTPAQLLRNLFFGGLLLGFFLVLPAFIPIGGWQRSYAILLGGASLALWVSSVFMVVDFGELDGTSFDLARHSTLLAYHSGWFALLLIATCFAMWKWPYLLMRSLGIIGAGLILITAIAARVTSFWSRPIWRKLRDSQMSETCSSC
jgi:hypothetical protein